MRILEYTVPLEQAGRTVRSIVLKEMKLSHSRFSSLKFQNAIFVDAAPARADRVLQAGQTIRVCLEKNDGEGESARRDHPAMTPAFILLEIPYQDEDFWIIQKPAPLPTLCSAHQSGPTLENALYAHLGCPAEYVFRPVNRLDKGTSGLLAVARNAHAQNLLQRQLHTPAFTRDYLAVCEGVPEKAQGRIELPIGKAGEGIRRCVRADGLPSATAYRVLESSGGRSLLRLRLETGRTHQIRVHLSAIGCPIVGDYLYGRRDDALGDRFALHSCMISFTHPLTNRRVQVESGLPRALEALLEGPLPHEEKNGRPE